MKKRWLVAATLLMGGLIVAALFLFKVPKGHEATLSDRTIVRFEKAGIGAIPYDSYPPIKAALAGYVPNRFQSRLGTRITTTFTCQPHEIGLVFLHRTADGKPKNDPSQFLSRIEFIESTGYVFNVGISGSHSSTGVMCVTQGPFPRRAPTLHMRLYEHGTDRLLFDLHVPNPGYKPTFPEWVPDAIPATQTVEPLIVTLKHGLAGVAEKYLSNEDIEIVSTDPNWTVATRQRQFWLTDATGNRGHGLSGLSPFEPAWKLHVRVRRDASAEFGTDEVWRTKLLALPAALKAERLRLRQVVAGVELTATALCSAGYFEDDGHTLTVTPTAQTEGGARVGGVTGNGLTYTQLDSGLPFFSLSHTTLDDDTELIPNVRDQTGRMISVEDRSGSSEINGVWTRLVQFEPTADTTDVQLEVIVNRGRTFEFLVAPHKPAPTNQAQ